MKNIKSKDMNKDFPVFVRGTNSNEVLYLLGCRDFEYTQRGAHAYVVKEGFENEGIITDRPINPKNNFEYIQREALSWAAWLNRNERYTKGDNARLFSEDESGGYLIYFNERALGYVIDQDRFDIPEVLSAVKLGLSNMSLDCVQGVVPVLPAGGLALKNIFSDKIRKPFFKNSNELYKVLIDNECSRDPFSF